LVAGYELFVWFQKESDYTFFSLEHDPNEGWHEYTLIEKEVPDE